MHNHQAPEHLVYIKDSDALKEPETPEGLVILELATMSIEQQPLVKESKHEEIEKVDEEVLILEKIEISP